MISMVCGIHYIEIANHLLLTTIADVVLVGCGESKETTIWKATEEGDASTVELLISFGQDVNAKNDSGDTPLLRATVYGRGEVANLLISKGAQVNTQNKFGYAPLDMAIKLNKTKIADLLRKHGAKTAEELKAEGK